MPAAKGSARTPLGPIPNLARVTSVWAQVGNVRLEFRLEYSEFAYELKTKKVWYKIKYTIHHNQIFSQIWPKKELIIANVTTCEKEATKSNIEQV